MKFCIALLFFTVALANARQWKTLRPLKDPLRPPPPAPSERIVGGHVETYPHEYPHQVALHIGGMYFCGGSLISMDIVLTAAHCLDGQSFAQVIAGAHNQATYESSQQKMRSDDLYVHERYDSYRITYDVGLIKMPHPFESNQYVQSICYSRSDPPVGDTVTPTGWGVYDDDIGYLSDVLREVNVPVMTNNECSSYYGDVYEGDVCIDAAGGKGTCSGDSGGPLHYGGRTVGITSFGSSRGCEVGYPDAFTRTSFVADWIERNSGVSPC